MRPPHSQLAGLAGIELPGQQRVHLPPRPALLARALSSMALSSLALRSPAQVRPAVWAALRVPSPVLEPVLVPELVSVSQPDRRSGPIRVIPLQPCAYASVLRESVAICA